MKLAGIFRGFPGLGRVVSGVELLSFIGDNYNADIKLFSYLQGEEYLRQKGYSSTFNVQSHDYSSIGIIPVSEYGEYLINQIKDFSPEIILIDGEPLMLQLLRLNFPNIKIVTLLNPFDVNNPYNQESSRLFFNDIYCKADLAIVHGFWKEMKPFEHNNFHSINTIIRKEVLSIKTKCIKNKISCIIGGGTVNSKSEFEDRSLSIVQKCIMLAEMMLDFEIHIFCGSKEIYNEAEKCLIPPSVTLYSNIENCKNYYLDSKLIIARAGRNTISEILYLGIPALVIPTGCIFRSKEQNANATIIEKVSNKMIVSISGNIAIESLLEKVELMIDNTRDNASVWIPGNKIAAELVLDLVANENI